MTALLNEFIISNDGSLEISFFKKNLFLCEEKDFSTSGASLEGANDQLHI
jgi:hypothetical protein